MQYSRRLGSDGLLARLLAADFPYDPFYRDRYAHPVIRTKYTVLTKTLHQWYDLTDPAVSEVAANLLREDATRKLKGRKVKHFEVVFSDEVSDTSPILGWLAIVTKRKGDANVE